MRPEVRRLDHSRGQTGVETLVVFIATVMGAASAASPLLSRVLSLQSQAIATSEESIEQVTERVQVVTAFGEVDDGRIETVTLRVRTAPGAESIDLSAVSVRTVGDGVDPNWSVGVVGSDRSVLTDGSELGYVRVYGESGLPAGSGLTPGERVTVRITTGAGATTVHVVTVPDTLVGQSVVEL